jgi:hypothetical protein
MKIIADIVFAQEMDFVHRKLFIEVSTQNTFNINKNKDAKWVMFPMESALIEHSNKHTIMVKIKLANNGRRCKNKLDRNLIYLQMCMEVCLFVGCFDL